MMEKRILYDSAVTVVHTFFFFLSIKTFSMIFFMPNDGKFFKVLFKQNIKHFPIHSVVACRRAERNIIDENLIKSKQVIPHQIVNNLFAILLFLLSTAEKHYSHPIILFWRKKSWFDVYLFVFYLIQFFHTVFSRRARVKQTIIAETGGKTKSKRQQIFYVWTNSSCQLCQGK